MIRQYWSLSNSQGFAGVFEAHGNHPEARSGHEESGAANRSAVAGVQPDPLRLPHQPKKRLPVIAPPLGAGHRQHLAAGVFEREGEPIDRHAAHRPASPGGAGAAHAKGLAHLTGRPGGEGQKNVGSVPRRSNAAASVNGLRHSDSAVLE